MLHRVTGKTGTLAFSEMIFHIMLMPDGDSRSLLSDVLTVGLRDQQPGFHPFAGFYLIADALGEMVALVQGLQNFSFQGRRIRPGAAQQTLDSIAKHIGI